jgi:hypothetical protein
MSASSILAAGASFLATQFPATITIAGINYSASTSGLRTEQVMEEFGAITRAAISFLIPISAFSPPASIPTTGAVVICTAPNALAKTYRVEQILPDATNSLVVLRCVEPAQ